MADTLVYIGTYAMNDGFYVKDQPLGYIAYEYQRLHIHFISVIQKTFNRLEYLVYGKTKVKDNDPVRQKNKKKKNGG